MIYVAAQLMMSDILDEWRNYDDLGDNLSPIYNPSIILRMKICFITNIIDNLIKSIYKFDIK
jgi:hypothetical protein